ncbi:tubulointerstitial nephritis antigen isoform X2 [Ciona intestinalis]
MQYYLILNIAASIIVTGISAGKYSWPEREKHDSFDNFQAKESDGLKELGIAHIFKQSRIQHSTFMASRPRRQPADSLLCASRQNLFSGKREPCCKGRNENCRVGSNGEFCYCDEFCNRPPQPDCCIDYSQICSRFSLLATPSVTLSVSTSTEPQTTNSPITSTTQLRSLSTFTTQTTTHLPISETVCFFDGVGYRLGSKKRRNCNVCICENVINGYFQFNCEENVCLVRPNVIEAINEGDFGWTASNFTFLWGLTQLEGYNYKLGTARVPDEVRNMNAMHPLSVSSNLPTTFDSRTKWPGSLSPPRDQENEGTSWAFSTTSVLSDRLAIQSKNSTVVELSSQHLVSCFSSHESRGERLDRAWWYLRKKGVVSTVCYPEFRSKSTQGIGSCGLVAHSSGAHICPNGNVISSNEIYKTSPVYRVSSTEENIMKEIFENGPVQAVMRVRPDFFVYKSGVYSSTAIDNTVVEPAKDNTYHSVKIIGWGEKKSNTNSGKYWTVQNSWGTHWGEGGYFRIRKGVNECGIEEMILAAWPQIPLSNGVG